MSSSKNDFQIICAEPSSSAVPASRRGENPVDLNSDSSPGEAMGSASPSPSAGATQAIEELVGFEFYDGAYAGRSLRDGVPPPPHHWEFTGPDGGSYGVQMPLRALGGVKIVKWEKNAKVPQGVVLRGVRANEDPTRLPNYLAGIHPVLFNWGLKLPVPRFLAHFCAYLSVPIGQLSANCLWVLTCLHVLWRASGCEYPTPAEVLQLYAPRHGTRKGHQGVVELKESQPEGLL